jgi:hypothetical protein
MKGYVEQQGGFVCFEVRECGIGEGWELILSERREEEGTDALYERHLENAYAMRAWPSESRGIRS